MQAFRISCHNWTDDGDSKAGESFPVLTNGQNSPSVIFIIYYQTDANSDRIELFTNEPLLPNGDPNNGDRVTIYVTTSDSYGSESYYTTYVKVRFCF